MKIMTINTHSYIESESEKKLNIFVDAISRLEPDIIAMQEVNQKSSGKLVDSNSRLIYKQFGIKLKNDNYGLRAAQTLFERGHHYKMIWLGIKRGFEIFDEGLCFLCKTDISSADAFKISKCDDIMNWKKRMALGIEVNGEYFYNVHMGRWDDKEEPFYNQWICLNEKVKSQMPVWLMGDFNSPADYNNEGYDCIISSGWYDTYTLAKTKDNGYTIKGKIDGWEDKKTSFKNERIDFIFTNTKKEILTSHTIFNGENENIISDHYGILVTYERK